MERISSTQAKGLVKESHNKKMKKYEILLEKIVKLIENEIYENILMSSRKGYDDYHHTINYTEIFNNFEEIEKEKYYYQPHVNKEEVDRVCKEIIKPNLKRLGYKVDYHKDISRFWISWY